MIQFSIVETFARTNFAPYVWHADAVPFTIETFHSSPISRVFLSPLTFPVRSPWLADVDIAKFSFRIRAAFAFDTKVMNRTSSSKQRDQVTRL